MLILFTGPEYRIHTLSDQIAQDRNCIPPEYQFSIVTTTCNTLSIACNRHRIHRVNTHPVHYTHGSNKQTQQAAGVLSVSNWDRLALNYGKHPMSFHNDHLLCTLNSLNSLIKFFKYVCKQSRMTFT